MKKIVSVFSLCLIIVFIGCKAKELTPDQQAKAQEYASKIEDRNFTFHARSAQPMASKSINLNYNYYLKVTKDTIIASLPYYGRAYSAPMNATDIGIDFTSTDFFYLSEKKNNGTYEIEIKPKDISNNQNQGISLRLSISPSGYGTLNTLSTNRQSISFYGTID